jgi:hypothetical protein
MRRLLPLVLLFAIGLAAGGPAEAATTLATAPTLGSATGMNGSVASWDVPAYDGGTKIVSYKIYRGTSPGNETLLTTVGAMTTMNDGLSIVNETTYYYRISAVNSPGEGPKSNS